jgi:uroporphyrinogen decarboxylase
MISLPMWRAIFKPHYQALVDETHRLGMDFILHSCGNVTALIEDLIEIGVDALDPIQPVAMDPVEVGRRFGGRIAFMGAVDIQELLTNGAPEDVRREVRRIIDLLAKPFGNSLVVGPANVLTPDVPLANIRALFEACHAT